MLILSTVVIGPGFKLISPASIKMNLRYNLYKCNEYLIDYNWIIVFLSKFFLTDFNTLKAF